MALNHIYDNLDIFTCPICTADLQIDNGCISCSRCHKQYQVKNGIPLLFLPTGKKDVTCTMKSFYEQTPFPDYEDLDNVSSFIQKAQRGVFAGLLNKQVPFNIRVLEVGCGTGQLSNYLGIAHRFVFGVDMSLSSLGLAHKFKTDNNLERVGFYQMNLFRPIFKDESFPLVICNGVLHHTSEPFIGFKTIARLVKKGGYIIIGLYNRYGRLCTDIRSVIFRLSGNRFKFLDSRLTEDIGEFKKNAWFLDQYKNPHASKHTIGEVLRWFDETGFEFVNSIPKLRGRFSENEKLFKRNSRGNLLDRFLCQTKLVFTGAREGGFFVLIGRRKN